MSYRQRQGSFQQNLYKALLSYGATLPLWLQPLASAARLAFAGHRRLGHPVETLS
jgi:hypothetical protein